MKRLFLLLGMLVTCISFYGAPVIYTGCTPETGSSISTFDITLNFDIAEAVNGLGSGEWGIGYTGNTSGTSTSIYEGTETDGKLLTTIMTSNFNGKSEGFIVDGSSIKLPIPVSIKPEIDKTYTIVIKNTFCVFESGKSTLKAATFLKFIDNPLVLTFTGGAASSTELILQDVSIPEDSEIKTLSEINYTFNESISVTNNTKVSITEGSEVVYEATSVSVLSDNDKVLSVKFPNGVELLTSHNYKLMLPAGTVSLSSDPTVVNKEFTINIKGTGYKYYTAASISPKDGEKGLFDSASIIYSLPSGTLLTHENIFSDTSIHLYKGDILSPDNLVTTLYGTTIQNNTGLKWDLSNIPFEPATDYVLLREAGKGKLFKDGTTLSEYSNEETKIRFSTPSVEEAGYAPMELGKPTLRGGSTVVNDGDIFSSIDRIEIAAPNLKYEYDGIKGGFFSDDASKKKGFLYDITDKEPVLVKEFLIDTQNRETATEYYNILCLFVNNILYEGREYRIVMPEGAFTIGSQRLWNYVRTPEFSITVKGATPTEVRLLGTSIADGAECSSLSDVIFNFNGDLAFDKDAVGTLRRYDASGKMDDIVTVPLTAHKEGADNITMVSAHVSYRTNGNPRILKKGCSYTLTIPAGCLYVESAPEIANEETVLNIKGVEAPPVITEPEYVSLQISYLGDEDAIVGSSSTEVVKGKTVSISVPSKDWNIASLMRYNGDSNEGTELKDFAESGLYTSSALNDNARFAVSLEYAAPLVFSDITTGVAVLPDSNIQVFSDNEKIVVKGLTGGELITVYTMAGIAVGSHESASDKDTVNIEAPKGQTYIVRVQKNDGYDYAAKIMH